MKLIAFGDIHGRNSWKSVLDTTDFDKAVFVGDYFDTHENISPEQQLDNFQEILLYKRSFPEKITLLIGNHDYHYLSFTTDRYSGFQEKFCTPIRLLLEDALQNRELQACYRHHHFLFSHAGITRTWLFNQGFLFDDSIPVEQFVNELFIKNPQAFAFTIGKNQSYTGDDICQTPIWVRPTSLSKDGIEGFVHVVGHTSVHHITFFTNKILLIDTLGISGEYLVIKDNQIQYDKVQV
ncbi:MAG: metallophosphoesterase [Cytophagales bacterium]|nr:metallophosphoesterase [Cytophagales bacterium]MDW8383242.1 metallophosphoesterase [Flammeovirgaceae bacterium]